jgi:putative FmdB family regulatory protein
MPIYEYVCDDCGFGFERLQSFHDAPLDTCPQCSGSVRRVITSVGVIFKGSGWYITDSRRQISSTAKGSSDKGNGSEKADKVGAAADASEKPAAEKPAKKEAPSTASNTPEKASA